MQDNLVSLHNECLKQVLNTNYYTDSLDGATHLCGYVSFHQVEKLSEDTSIVQFWCTFFELLPDSDDIDRPPFDLVSDLATFKFDNLV